MSNELRNVLIVDDQHHIHDTFRRIFTECIDEDESLAAFESEFLDDGIDQPSSNSVPRPVFSLTHANSGEKAIELVQECQAGQAFAVAFVDMRMPGGIDGLETTKRIWEIDPRIQVVICTAHSDHTWDEVMETLGYNDRLLLLRKPFEANEAWQAALALSEKWRLSAEQTKKMDTLSREVERRKTAEVELRSIAHRDALTSLPNRPYLLQKLDSILANYDPESEHESALLFLDLDNFKVINDSLGHGAGDDLLNQVARRLQDSVRGNRAGEETIRLGGDEFVMLLEQLRSREDALKVARRIVKRIAEPFHLGDRMVNVGTSVGVAYISTEVNNAHDVLRNADTAMYRAKNSGKGQVAVFDQTMHDAAVTRHTLETELRQALKNDLFELHYQPIIDLHDSRIAGVEVLIRWESNGRNVPPGEFIPIAEEIGLIQDLGEWVLENTMREFGGMLNSLSSQINRDIYAAVNVSSRQLSDPFFASRLEDLIQKTNFDRSALKLEMGESGDPRHKSRSIETMLQLHQSGIGIHIDDFGKGNSSLACFKDYPIEAVKIDRSFSSAITNDTRNQVILQSLINLTHQLDSMLVCEGVESEEQLALLKLWQCDRAQGYLFSPPVSLSELRELIENPHQSVGLQKLNASFPNLEMGASPIGSQDSSAL